MNKKRLVLFGSTIIIAYPLYDSKIKFHHVDTISNRELIDSIPSLANGRFYPTPWIAAGSLQTIYAMDAKNVDENLNYRDEPIYNRELLTVSCGGTISLDWASSENLKDNTKILFIIPGLTGGSEGMYIQDIVHLAQTKGFRVAVFHGRGINGTLLTVTAI